MDMPHPDGRHLVFDPDNYATITIDTRSGIRTVVVDKALPADLPEVWPFVRRGLVWIKRRQVQKWGDRATWTPEHVYASLMGNQSELHIARCQDDLTNAAFTVTQVLIDPFLHVPTGCFVWMAYSEPKLRTDAVDKMDAHLTQMARERGLSYMECLTTRDGLGRRMQSRGWKTIMHVLRKDLY